MPFQYGQFTRKSGLLINQLTAMIMEATCLPSTKGQQNWTNANNNLILNLTNTHGHFFIYFRLFLAQYNYTEKLAASVNRTRIVGAEFQNPDN